MFAHAGETKQKKTDMPVQKKTDPPNQTGIPDKMKARFENNSGFSFDDVKVHYNSSKPARLQALAYTQGNQVHIAPGQEKHLGHELGHVVQQKRGIVRPTTSVGGVAVNDDAKLEKAADNGLQSFSPSNFNADHVGADVVQMMGVGELMEYGRRWFDLVNQFEIKGKYTLSKVTKQTTEAFRKEFNEKFSALGFSLNTCWHPHDPVIRGSGKFRAYASFVSEFNKDPTENAANALSFINGEKNLEDLSNSLQEFMIIVFVAEVGRGYEPGLGALVDIICDVSNGCGNWTEILSFCAAIPTKFDRLYKDDGCDETPDDMMEIVHTYPSAVDYFCARSGGISDKELDANPELISQCMDFILRLHGPN